MDTKLLEAFRRLADGIITSLSYPRGSEAQVRCMEEIRDDAVYLLKQFPKSEETDLDEPMYRIVCAALRHTGTGLVICGARHFDHVMLPVIRKLFPSGSSFDQGFINNKGEFLTREQAWVVAERAGQIRRCLSTVEGELHSEELY